jgi:hypothetical protein
LADALQSLSTLPVAESTEIERVTERNEAILPLDGERFGSSRIVLGYFDQTVLDVEIEVDGNLALSQIIDFFGNPPWITGDESCAAGDRAGYEYNLAFWYPERGVTVSTRPFDVDNPQTDLAPKPLLLINLVIFHRANMEPEEWAGKYGFPQDVSILDYLHPWPGWENPLPSYTQSCQ